MQGQEARASLRAKQELEGVKKCCSRAPEATSCTPGSLNITPLGGEGQGGVLRGRRRSLMYGSRGCIYFSATEIGEDRPCSLLIGRCTCFQPSAVLQFHLSFIQSDAQPKQEFSLEGKSLARATMCFKCDWLQVLPPSARTLCGFFSFLFFVFST